MSTESEDPEDSEEKVWLLTLLLPMMLNSLMKLKNSITLKLMKCPQMSVNYKIESCIEYFGLYYNKTNNNIVVVIQ